jgi:hypothetical protein
VHVAGIETIDGNGRVTLPGFARGTSGHVLDAQGTGFTPMYVDPNGRYTPAAHESGHANLYPSAGNNNGQCGNTSNYWNVCAKEKRNGIKFVLRCLMYHLPARFSAFSACLGAIFHELLIKLFA